MTVSSIPGIKSVITPPSGRSLVIPIFFRLFLGGHLPQASGFRSAKEILVVPLLHSQGLLSSVTVTYFTPPGGRTMAVSNAPGAFLVCI